METKICNLCGKEKPLSEFYSYWKGRKGLTARCKECIKHKNLEYYARTKEQYHKQRAEYRGKHREEIATQQRKEYAEKRLLIIQHYGGKCACCGEDEPLFLEIDHINNDGWTHRKEIETSAKALVLWIIRNNYPDGFQILCANCNQGKKRGGGICPHKLRKDQ